MNNYKDYYNYNNMKDYYNYENNNYNQPMYGQNTNNILDPYQGFIRGNMFSDLYNSYKLERPVNIKPQNKQAEMLTTIDSLCFAMIDLDLYLDIHPEDKRALELYEFYRRSHDEYMEAYQKEFGPIELDSASIDGNYWTWILSPWPWEVEK